jgi:presenilin-like A22 family membrane protease
MVKMAKRLVEDGGLFALLVPFRPRALNLKLSQVEQKKEVFQLGTGDLVLPGIMAVSAGRIGLGTGLAVLVGSLIGLSVNLMIFFKQDKPRPIPALPAPAAGAVLAYLLVTVIS